MKKYPIEADEAIKDIVEILYLRDDKSLVKIYNYLSTNKLTINKNNQLILEVK